MSVDAFRSAMIERGLSPPLAIEPGKIHRFPGAGKGTGNTAGWCKLFPDGAGGVFGDWSADWQDTWQAQRETPLTARELAERRRQIAEARREAEKQRREVQAAAAAEARRIWDAAAEAPADHPYLSAKRIQPHGLRTHEGRLVVPVRIAGALTSLQFIAADGSKRFLSDGAVAGGYCSIGRPDGKLAIAEGFATAAAIREATGLAVAVAYSAGNLMPVARAIGKKLPHVQIIVAADDDAHQPSNPGLTHGTAAARATGARVAVPDFGDTRPAGATDFCDLYRHAGPDAVRTCIERAVSVAPAAVLGDEAQLVGRSAPEPLRRPVAPPAPYPLDALGDILAPAARAIRRVIQAPDAIVGASVLAAASLAVQALADVEIDGRVHPLSLWLVSIAESGERKSAVDAEAMRAARAWEKELAEGYEQQLRDHEADVAEHQARVESAKRAARKAGGKGLADALRKIGPAPPAPIIPRVSVADFTAEGLFKLLAIGLPSVGAFTDEAALVFGGHGMTDEAIRRTAGTLCKLWDRGDLDRVRAGDGAMKLYGRRLSMHLMAQPVIAERALSDDVLSGQGFLARCLLSWPQGTAGSRAYSPDSLQRDPDVGAMAQRLGQLHRRPLPIEAGKRQELDPPHLRLTAEAKAAWVQLHDGIERAQTEGGQFYGVRPWASKLPEQVLRIAGVLALVADPSAAQISLATIEAAAELGLWHLTEAVRVHAAAETSREIGDAQALLDWCHKTGRQLLHSGEALQSGPARVRDLEAFTRAMERLTEAGWATRIDGGAVVGGKHRRKVWAIEPPQGVA